MTQIVLTSGTTWTVPADWTSSGSTVVCIGTGGSGAHAPGSSQGGGGGAGGGCAKGTNFILTPGATVNIKVGTGDTYFNPAAAVFPAAGNAVGARAGPDGSGATGGTAPSTNYSGTGAGNLVFKGGNGGTSGGSQGGSGGGGAGSPAGAGSNGANASGTNGANGGASSTASGGVGSGAGGGVGGNGTDFGSVGAGAGGAGGALFLTGFNGGNGGLYGGGGGGGGPPDIGTVVGVGGAGLIVITYTPQTLVAANGTYTLTGIAATLSKGYRVVAAKGAYVLTGIAAHLVRNKTLIVTTGAYALTGLALILARFRQRSDHRLSDPKLNRTRVVEPVLYE